MQPWRSLRRAIRVEGGFAVPFQHVRDACGVPAADCIRRFGPAQTNTPAPVRPRPPAALRPTTAAQTPATTQAAPFPNPSPPVAGPAATAANPATPALAMPAPTDAAPTPAPMPATAQAPATSGVAPAARFEPGKCASAKRQRAGAPAPWRDLNQHR